MDKISIIVPVYNVAGYLPQCLDSLINQSYSEVEVICVNDGSTDNSADILREYQAMSDKITVITQANSGVSVARNTGMNAATGDWVMFVDSDDWIDLDTCDQMISTSIREKADVVMGSYVKEYSSHSEIVHIFSSENAPIIPKHGKDVHRRLFGPIKEETSAPMDVDILVSPCMQLFRHSLLDGIHFPDIRETGTFEDGLFQIAVYEHCTGFSYIDKPFYHYRKTNVSSITTKYKAKLAEQHERVYALLEKQIISNNYSEDYTEALNNRIVFELIGIGINEARANARVSEKAKKLREILHSPCRRVAFSKLDFMYLPWKWKAFFTLMKRERTYMVMLFLSMVVSFHDRV